MTPRQIELVRDTWGALSPTSEALAKAFYEHLFRLDPMLRRLFSADMNGQQRALMEFLNVAVNGLSCFEELILEIEDLGLRHVQYGVQLEHFGIVREALTHALADLLGPRFTAEVAAAWGETYDQLARVMIDAAYSPASHWRGESFSDELLTTWARSPYDSATET